MGTSWENIPEIREVHGGDQLELQAPDLIRLLLFCQVLLLVLQSTRDIHRGTMSKPLWDKFEQTSRIPLPLFKM